MKTTPCTEKLYAFNNAPRCGAKTRQRVPCQSPAVKDKLRCRMHGGAKGSGAPKGNTYAVTHGQSTAEIKAFKRTVRQLIAEVTGKLKNVHKQLNT
jgi:hypothetical protein